MASGQPHPKRDSGGEGVTQSKGDGKGKSGESKSAPPLKPGQTKTPGSR